MAGVAELLFDFHWPTVRTNSGPFLASSLLEMLKDSLARMLPTDIGPRSSENFRYSARAVSLAKVFRKRLLSADGFQIGDNILALVFLFEFKGHFALRLWIIQVRS